MIFSLLLSKARRAQWVAFFFVLMSEGGVSLMMICLLESIAEWLHACLPV